jgi:hypothetical protein
MKPFFNKVFCFLKDNILRLLHFRESSVRNFIIFTACYAALNVSTRLFLLKHFSSNLNVFVIYWIVTVISTASLLSIVVFYIRNNHIDKVEAFLNWFVDVKRIKENKRKRIECISWRHSNSILTFVIRTRFRWCVSHSPLQCALSQSRCCDL